MENIDLLLNLLDTGTLVVFVYLFATGKVLSEKSVDKILENAAAQTKLMVVELLEAMAVAVATGVETGMRQANEKKKE